MRKLLAKLRHYLESRGLAVRPHTHRQTGNYSGFSLSWGRDQEGLFRGTVSRVRNQRGEALFFVENERDFIQQMHLHGRFYEEEELQIIAEHFSGGTYLDVGANVGNHAVFAGLFLPVDRIIAIEPNPRPARILEMNLRLNGLFAKSEIKRVGLSDSAAEASMIVHLVNNIGAAHVGAPGVGDTAIQLVRGDEILGDATIGFVKMDIEGHELRALTGMRSVLERDKPTVLVEVEARNDQGVLDLMTGLGYRRERVIRFAPDRANQLFIHP